MKQKEEASIQEGHMLITDAEGKPLLDTGIIWCVWYYRNSESKYYVLIKTFNTNKETVKKQACNLKKNDQMIDCETGIGFLDVRKGQMKLLKIGEENENQNGFCK